MHRGSFYQRPPQILVDWYHSWAYSGSNGQSQGQPRCSGTCSSSHLRVPTNTSAWYSVDATTLCGHVSSGIVLARWPFADTCHQKQYWRHVTLLTRFIRYNINAASLCQRIYDVVLNVKIITCNARVFCDVMVSIQAAVTSTCSTWPWPTIIYCLWRT